MREATFFCLNAAFWWAVAVGLLLVADVFRPMVAAPRTFVACHVGGCFVATLLIRWFARAIGLLTRIGVSRIGAMAGSLIVATVATTICTAPLDARFGLPPGATPRRFLLAMFAVHLALLATWCLLYFGHRLLREVAAAAQRARDAEARLNGRFESRLDPRFLLDAVAALAACREDPEAVDALARALGDYLRLLEEPTAPLEPLGRELDLVAAYLAVQQLRLGTGLEATVECDTALYGIPVLPMMIQPLVENAVAHGGVRGAVLRIVVRVSRAGRDLVVEVGNTGRWIQPDTARSHRSGLRALRRRLEYWSGLGATLTTSEEVGWVWVTIRAALESRYAAPVAAGA